tara:strand:+ start:32179 stop:32550 length:372 start_codon:yes stop_codon:yes gene_type:complete
MNAQNLLATYMKDTKKVKKTIESFFADVVLGVGEWEYRNLISGRTVIAPKMAVFSEGFSVLNRENAIVALNRLVKEVDIDLTEEIAMIEEAKNTMTLRKSIPISLMSAIQKVEPELIETPIAA